MDKKWNIMLSSHLIQKKSLKTETPSHFQTPFAAFSFPSFTGLPVSEARGKSQGLCLSLALLFYCEDCGFESLSSLAPGHYLLRSPEEVSSVIVATSLWGPVLGLIQAPAPGGKLQMVLLFLDPGMLPMNEPVTWKSQLSLQSLVLTPLFPFIVLSEFLSVWGMNFPLTRMKWPRVNWAGPWFGDTDPHVPGICQDCGY